MSCERCGGTWQSASGTNKLCVDCRTDSSSSTFHKGVAINDNAPTPKAKQTECSNYGEKWFSASGATLCLTCRETPDSQLRSGSFRIPNKRGSKSAGKLVSEAVSANKASDKFKEMKERRKSGKKKVCTKTYAVFVPDLFCSCTHCLSLDVGS
jgi:hypothetical protein